MIHFEPAGVELQAQLFKTPRFGATFFTKKTKYTNSNYALL